MIKKKKKNVHKKGVKRHSPDVVQDRHDNEFTQEDSIIKRIGN